MASGQPGAQHKKREAEKMEYICNLIVVTDMERSKRFYRELLGQNVVADLGANVTLSGGFALQTQRSWAGFLEKDETEVKLGGNDAELYFEEKDFDAFIEKVKTYGAVLVHPPKEHPWGQRVVRFYDPDLHIVEVGESMARVVGRFLQDGLTMEETAARMNVPIGFVQAYAPKDA